jgi:hypothetical protein
MAQKGIDLADLFKAVAHNLEQNQEPLNQADSYNHDHGTNMAHTFKTISSAVAKKKGSSASAQLAYAAKELSKTATSGSARLYAENLGRAAEQFKGKPVTQKGALDLLSTLIGSEQNIPQQPAQTAPSAGGDLLSSLLGGMTGGQAPQQPAQQAPTAGGDLLSSLLGGMGGGTGPQQAGGFGLDDLLQAGMAYMQAKQQGQSSLMAIIQAVAAASRMGSSAPYRSQSTQLVIGSFLQALGGMPQ